MNWRSFGKRDVIFARACLKKAFRELRVSVCGRFYPNEGGVAGYGNIIKAGTTSPYSLYNESLASFTTGDMYDHHDADGFITLFGLPLKVRAMKLAEVKNNQNQN